MKTNTINNKYFIMSMNENQEIFVSLGNLDDTGYYWVDQGASPDLWYFFGTLVSNENLFDDFFDRIEKTDISFEVVKRILVESQNYWNYYPFLGGNVFWHFEEDKSEIEWNTIQEYFGFDDDQEDKIIGVIYKIKRDFRAFCDWLNENQKEAIQIEKQILNRDVNNWQELKDYIYWLYRNFYDSLEYEYLYHDFILSQLEKGVEK